MRGLQAQIRELSRKIDKQATVVVSDPGEWTEAHNRHRGKAVGAKLQPEREPAADGDAGSGGQVVPSLQDSKARLKAAREIRASVPEGCPSRVGLDAYIGELEKLVEKARTPAARLQALENACTKSSAALVAATTKLQDVEALATEINKRLLAAREEVAAARKADEEARARRQALHDETAAARGLGTPQLQSLEVLQQLGAVIGELASSTGLDQLRQLAVQIAGVLPVLQPLQQAAQPARAAGPGAAQPATGVAGLIDEDLDLDDDDLPGGRAARSRSPVGRAADQHTRGAGGSTTGS